MYPVPTLNIFIDFMYDVTFLKNLIFSKFGVKLTSLAFFGTKLAFRLNILWQRYFDARKDIINTLLQKKRNTLLKFIM